MKLYETVSAPMPNDIDVPYGSDRPDDSLFTQGQEAKRRHDKATNAGLDISGLHDSKELKWAKREFLNSAFRYAEEHNQPRSMKMIRQEWKRRDTAIQSQNINRNEELLRKNGV